MAFKFIAVLALIAAVNGSGYAPATRDFEEEELVNHSIEKIDHNPKYTFSYGVNDIVSGDSKSQTETRDGDAVRGEYSLIDADGYKRIVKYTADGLNGFNAVVDRQLLHKEPIAAPVVVESPIVAELEVKTITPAVTYEAPTVIKSAPIVYNTPTIVRKTFAAPSLIRSVPALLEARSILRSLPFALSSLIRSGGIALSAPAHGLVRSIPATYGQW